MRLTITTLAFVTLVAFSCNNSSESKKTSDTTAATDHTATHDTGTNTSTDNQTGSVEMDREFVMKAAISNTAEVGAGKLATQKSKDSEVKGFGQKMVKDHSDAQSKLKSIATAQGFNAPDSIDTEHEAMKKKLQGLTGKDFDREYMNGQVKDHEAAIALFERQVATGSNAALKEFATTTLPHLRMHLEEAQKVAGKLNQQ